MLMPMRLFSIFLTVCSHLSKSGFALSSPRICRQLCKLLSKLVKRWRLQLLQVAPNHTSIMFPLSFPLLLICGHRWCPWSWVVRAFLAHATIAARLAIGLQSAGCRSDRSLANQLPIIPKYKSKFYGSKGKFSNVQLAVSCLQSLVLLQPGSFASDTG